MQITKPGTYRAIYFDLDGNGGVATIEDIVVNGVNHNSIEIEWNELDFINGVYLHISDDGERIYQAAYFFGPNEEELIIPYTEINASLVEASQILIERFLEHRILGGDLIFFLISIVSPVVMYPLYIKNGKNFKKAVAEFLSDIV